MTLSVGIKPLLHGHKIGVVVGSIKLVIRMYPQQLRTSTRTFSSRIEFPEVSPCFLLNWVLLILTEFRIYLSMIRHVEYRFRPPLHTATGRTRNTSDKALHPFHKLLLHVRDNR